MNINFNNLRKQTAYALDNVIKTLNAGILPQEEMVMVTDANGKTTWPTGNVLIQSEDLQKDIDELR